ncbi:energy-coupling factor ABC transporter ATP-binding protein [Rhizobiaceae bacterium n13]|uniref:Energy-coupling factor ABC transporter ATP-binding protein n=1 Tax=Ferirhizobium litorale TaxID=2927786 RepID=A0AAE3QD07_9HYPH|nr:ABC transporter ATP-binding protein [Fererhizobium litorale]MDI7861446.1 energy-coupling factor ABC transporter ATP-binding protein [Fererhizobium litorale]MDI7921593.1 energy-coupling factor ABC transporter ATP-binding protein [Fererhizobium litorale]
MDIRFEGAGARFGERIALEPLTLTLTERRIGIIGLNGSGKTTFARMINGLTKPTEGRVTVNGLDTRDDAASVLSMVGFIFQNPQNQIILPIVRDDIGFGLKNRGMGKAEIRTAVDVVLARFQVSHLAERRAHELSGGELQLAALCAVLVTRPQVLILDEPTNQLDLKNRALVERTIEGLNEDVVVISHDLELVDDFDRVLVFDKGRLAVDAPPEEAITRYRELVA